MKIVLHLLNPTTTATTTGSAEEISPSHQRKENISICILNAGKNQRKGSDSTLVSVGVWLNTRAVEGAA